MELKDRLKGRWRAILSLIIIIVVAVILVWQVAIGLLTSLWNVPLLTILAFALWIAIYVFISSLEESA